MSIGEFWLADEQFARLAPLLPRDTRGLSRVDDRRVISGIVHLLRSGCRWKDVPACYGPHKTLYNRFVRWAAKGVWEGVFLRLPESGGPPAALMLDATHVKALLGGRRKGEPTRRRSVARAAAGRRRSMPPSTSTAGRDG